MTARKPGARQGRPVEVPRGVVIAIREALGRGEPVATVAKAWGVSARYVRNLRSGERRPEAVAEPPAIEALETVEGELADDARQMRELWSILAGR
jgi:hypothetical protein